MSTTSNGHAIDVDNLRKSYGSVVAVDGISFQVEQREIFGLLGPNGAGKTTTVEILEGLREADAGRAIVSGVDVRKDPKAVEILLLDPKDMFRWLKVRGRLLETTTRGAAEHIDRLSLRYAGNPKYQSSQPGEQRITLKVEPVRVSHSWGSWE